MDFPIDFVVTWVDGSDEKWRRKKRKYSGEKIGVDDGDSRYRDYGLLKNWFDRVWKYTPWVRNVFLVTDDQAPKWVVDEKRITIINHEQFIPHEYLPTFNSSVIEMNLWRIKELAEHFVYFNDDMYITQSIRPDEFFSGNGLPVLNGSIHPVVPRDNFSKNIFNNMVIVNELFPKRKYFKTNIRKYLAVNKYGFVSVIPMLLSIPYSNWLGFDEDHLAYPNLKSWFVKLNKNMPEIFEETSGHRFRTQNDYTIWLLKNLYIASGNFVPRSYKFGRMMGLTQLKDLKQVTKIMKKNKIIVINDSFNNKNAEKMIIGLQKIMEINK